jgi:hypothetical protein
MLLKKNPSCGVLESIISLKIERIKDNEGKVYLFNAKLFAVEQWSS